MSKEKIETVKLSTDIISRCVKLSEEIKELQEKEKSMKQTIASLAGIQSGSIKLEDANGATATITLTERTSWNQELLNEALSEHPTIAKEYFRMEWKPVDQKAVDRKLESVGSKVWKQIMASMKKSVSETIRLKGGK